MILIIIITIMKILSIYSKSTIKESCFFSTCKMSLLKNENLVFEVQLKNFIFMEKSCADFEILRLLYFELFHQL